jgi:hypothetical protein
VRGNRPMPAERCVAATMPARVFFHAWRNSPSLAICEVLLKRSVEVV